MNTQIRRPAKQVRACESKMSRQQYSIYPSLLSLPGAGQRGGGMSERLRRVSGATSARKNGNQGEWPQRGWKQYGKVPKPRPPATLKMELSLARELNSHCSPDPENGVQMSPQYAAKWELWAPRTTS